MKNKKDSYMGDVGIIKKIDDIPELKEKLIKAFDTKCHSHKDISQYGLLLAKHILELTDTKMDDAIGGLCREQKMAGGGSPVSSCKKRSRHDARFGPRRKKTD